MAWRATNERYYAPFVLSRPWGSFCPVTSQSRTPCQAVRVKWHFQEQRPCPALPSPTPGVCNGGNLGARAEISRAATRQIEAITYIRPGRPNSALPPRRSESSKCRTAESYARILQGLRLNGARFIPNVHSTRLSPASLRRGSLEPHDAGRPSRSGEEGQKESRVVQAPPLFDEKRAEWQD